jgi:hypothetical protein
MPAILTKARTALALGLPNIARNLAYSGGVKSGLNPVRRLRAAMPDGAFFTAPSLPPVDLPLRAAWSQSGMMFSRWPVPLGVGAPNWLANPLTGAQVQAAGRPWWQIPDFDPAVGDIKAIWELSRMDWVIAFAQRARNGDDGALERLNAWLADWFAHNPPYCGPNWKCGQEASIRVMHLACASILLGQVLSASPALRAALRMHLQRIAPTLMYAVAQDNNHGTSEAAALYIGGSWLVALGEPGAQHWASTGRRWLEDRALRLVGADGSFSQYSINYHRMMLDTFGLAEIWRSQLGLMPLSAQVQERVRAAAQWLRHVTSDVDGDAPNIGANDGARLLQFTDSAYRDHRPSVQLATALFCGQRAYAGEGDFNDAFLWLGIALPTDLAPHLGNYVADDGGFAMLRRGKAMALLRYPRFRFRPGQADALHLDVWLDGVNLLRDAGTYSYNTEPRWLAYFGGTASHNTVQFDGRDQMPRLSRFLLGDWIRTSWLEGLRVDQTGTTFGAGYRDRAGAMHKRRVMLSDDCLRITDELGGRFGSAVLRWRLASGNWKLQQRSHDAVLACADTGVTFTLCSGMPIVRCELVAGWESRHYLEKTPVTVLELEFGETGTISTEVSWAS